MFGLQDAVGLTATIMSVPADACSVSDLEYTRNSLDYEKAESAALVLTALFQEGHSDCFKSVASSLQRMDCGSDLYVSLLAAVWGRDLPLIEAFFRHVKMELGNADEFCGVSPAASPCAAGAAASRASATSIGIACLHASVELGYYEGVLAFLNFGVPVDGSCHLCFYQSSPFVFHQHAFTALMRASCSDMPISIVQDVAGLLLSRGADASFLAEHELPSAAPTAPKSFHAIKTFFREHTSNGVFRPPFVHMSSAVASRDTVVKAKSKKFSRKSCICTCRSGLCQLSRASSSSAPCPCLANLRDPFHKVSAPLFWSHPHMSFSAIESCVKVLESRSTSRACPRDSLACADAVVAAAALRQSLSPLAAMKTGWAVLNDPQYAMQMLNGNAVEMDNMMLAGALAMMGGLADFIDCQRYSKQCSAGVGSLWLKTMNDDMHRQQHMQTFVNAPAALAWMLLQLEAELFNLTNVWSLSQSVRQIDVMSLVSEAFPREEL
jgi:hypothetical protein